MGLKCFLEGFAIVGGSIAFIMALAIGMANEKWWAEIVLYSFFVVAALVIVVGLSFAIGSLLCH